MSTKFPLIFLMALFLAACKSKPAAPPERSFPVHVGQVVTREIPLQIEAIGNVTAPQLVQIRAQVSGKIEKSYVEQGAFVREGELLFNIEPYPFQAALDSAVANLQRDEANLVYARQTLERFGKLIDKEFISKNAYEQYQRDVAIGEAAVAQDKAQIEIAKINLGYAFIRAPWDGRIGNFNTYPGNIVGPNDTISLTDLRQMRPIEVDFTIPQTEFQRLKEYREKNPFRVDAYLPGEKEGEGHQGVMDFMDNHVDLATGTILLKGEFPNEDLALWPGEFATVRLVLEKIPNALLVPSPAVQIGQQGHYVYVVKGDRVELRVVEIGERYENGTLTHIKSGVTADEIVVTDGQINLKPKAKVTIAQPKAEPVPLVPQKGSAETSVKGNASS